MIGGDTFEVLYDPRAHAPVDHQELRPAHPPLTTLAGSSARLYQTRLAMWEWHSRNIRRMG